MDSTVEMDAECAGERVGKQRPEVLIGDNVIIFIFYGTGKNQDNEFSSFIKDLAVRNSILCNTERFIYNVSGTKYSQKPTHSL